MIIFTTTIISNSFAEEVEVHIDKYDESGNLVSGNVIANKIPDGRVFHQGDIFLGYYEDLTQHQGPTAKGAVISGDSSKWPLAIVPYTFDSSFTTANKNAIIATMGNLESISGLRFVPRTNQTEYLKIIRDLYYLQTYGGCYSGVGRNVGTYTEASLVCGDSVNTHELLHALSFDHEQVRSDRDQYINVQEQNIESSCLSQFQGGGLQNLGNYDYVSIMHYGSLACSKNGQATMSRISGSGPLGGDELSTLDIQSLQTLYGHLPTTNLSVQSLRCYGDNILRWDSVAGASQYKIEKYSSSQGGWIQQGTTSSLAFPVHIPYSQSFRIKACNATGGCSIGSNEVLARYSQRCL